MHPMYLSRIELAATNPKTRRALASPQVLHAAVEGCFPSLPGEDKPRKLWRIDSLNQRLYLMMVSPIVPDFSDFCAQFSPTDITGETRDYSRLLSNIQAGQRYKFRFRGNPVHSVSTEKGQRGKVYAHVTVQQKRDWLMKKAKSCGFALTDTDFELMETGHMKFKRGESKKPVEIAYSVFEGVLTVTDEELFIYALTQGIGRGKAYGCGLITIAR